MKFTLWFYKLCSFFVVNLLNSAFPYRESMEQGLSQSVQYLTNTKISFRGNNQDVDTVHAFVTLHACCLSHQTS